MPSVSVIVPVYNVEDYLEKCLDSLGKQTLEDIEIIVVDDGSTDGSSSIIDKEASIYPNITALHVPNGGVSKARNIGLEKAGGRYIGFVDSDDYVDSTMFEKMLKRIEETGADIVQCWTCEGGRSAFPIYTITGKNELITANMDKVVSSNVWNKLYSRSLIGDIRFVDDLRFGEDFAFNAAVLTKASKVSFVPEILYYYISRESSETHRDINPEHLKSLRFFDFLRDRFPSNSAIREREICESLCLLDSIIGHRTIGPRYEKDLTARIRNNRKYIRKNRYLSGAEKIRSRFVVLFPSLYISTVRLYKALRIKNA